LVNNTDAHRKQRESLPPEKKVKILETNNDAHRKQGESLPPEKKVKILKLMLMHIKRKKSPFHLKTKTYL
jgi:hypothetical protein